jgi:hypothetical protein
MNPKIHHKCPPPCISVLIRSTHSHTLFEIHFCITLYLRWDNLRSLFTSGFQTKSFQEFKMPHAGYMPNSFYLTLWSSYLMVKNTKYMSVILCSCTQFPVASSIWGMDIYLSALFSSIPILCCLCGSRPLTGSSNRNTYLNFKTRNLMWKILENVAAAGLTFRDFDWNPRLTPIQDNSKIVVFCIIIFTFQGEK